MAHKYQMFFIVIFLFALAFSEHAQGVEIKFTPRIGASESYTSNVFLSSDNEEDDFLTILHAGGTAMLSGKSSGLEMSWDPSYAIYKDFDDNNSWRHHGTFLGWVPFSKKARFRVRDLLRYTEDPLPEEPFRDLVERILRREPPLLPIDTTVRRGRKSYLRNGFAADLNYEFGRTDSVKLMYLHRSEQNDDKDIEDKEELNPWIDITYWLTPHWGIYSGIDYTKGLIDGSDDFDNYRGFFRLTHRFTRRFDGFTEYNHIIRDFNGTTPDYEIFNPSIGIRYAFTKDIPFSFSVGYFYRKADELNDDKGIIFEVDSGTSLEFDRGSFYLTATSGYETTDFAAENLGFEQYYQGIAGVSYGFSKRFNSDAAIGYKRSDFVDTLDNRKDHVLRANVGISYKLKPWMILRLGYLNRMVNSNRSDVGYTEHRGMIRLIINKERPFRSVW